MNLTAFLPYYFSWHYTKAYSHIYGIWKNFLRFTCDFFSIGLLFKTLFSKWERLGEEYRKGEGIEATAETAFINFIMRIVGIIVRLPVIILGMIAFVLVFSAGILFFVVWTLLPFIVVLFLIFGIIGIFKK